MNVYTFGPVVKISEKMCAGIAQLENSFYLCIAFGNNAKASDTESRHKPGNSGCSSVG